MGIQREELGSLVALMAIGAVMGLVVATTLLVASSSARRNPVLVGLGTLGGGAVFGFVLGAALLFVSFPGVD